LEIYKEYIKKDNDVIFGWLGLNCNIFTPMKKEFSYDENRYNMNLKMVHYDEPMFNKMTYGQAIRLSDCCAIDKKTGHIIIFDE
jgi:hypothetical protein